MMSRVFTAVRNSRGRLIVAFVATLVVVAGGTAAGVVLTTGGSSVRAQTAPAKPSASLGSPAPTTTPATEPPSIVPIAPPAPVTGGATVVTTSNLVSDTCLYSHEANDDPIRRAQVRGTFAAAIQDQQLMAEQHGFGNHTPETTRLCQPNESDDRMN